VYKLERIFLQTDDHNRYSKIPQELDGMKKSRSLVQLRLSHFEIAGVFFISAFAH
jgi:hypothetical protein